MKFCWVEIAVGEPCWREDLGKALRVWGAEQDLPMLARLGKAAGLELNCRIAIFRNISGYLLFPLPSARVEIEAQKTGFLCWGSVVY